MAVKSITIDAEAYKRLKNLRRADESFSETIKRIAPRPVNLAKLFKSFDKDPISPEFAKAVEEQVSQRRQAARRKRQRTKG
jgi:predicted CopG family antitoxin